jgi:hypothetical protein
MLHCPTILHDLVIMRRSFSIIANATALFLLSAMTGLPVANQQLYGAMLE